MQNYRSIFPKRHTFLAVIHVENGPQAIKNTYLAQENGADGVFLINHSMSPAQLISIYATLRYQFPSFWMGLNMLGISPLHALGRVPDNECGLWVDNAGVSESGHSTDAEEFKTYRSKNSSWQGLYFGGVAFKGQEEVYDITKVAQLAVPFVDVITTSGASTGSAPLPDKIEKMKRVIGSHPLAIASGMTPKNVCWYLDWADCFLVATGVSLSFTELSPSLVRAFAKAIH